MGGQARIEYPAPAAAPVSPAAARAWLNSPAVQQFIAGLQDPQKGIPDSALTQTLHVTVEWA